MSNGAVAGVVVGILAGIVLLAAAVGFFYRKHSRKRDEDAPWAKIRDDDVTPFPPHEKFSDDDYYGPSSAPVIGSRRALALARQNNFNDDGTMRPQSEFVTTNHAGFGAGSYSAYPALPTAYAFDPQGRPYNPDAGRTPMPHAYEDVPNSSPHAYSTPDNSRQLIGSRGFPEPEPLTPHTLGRPAPPTSQDQLSHLEDYDIEGPAYDAPQSMAYAPHTASTMSEWSGDVKRPLGPSVPSMGSAASPSNDVEVLRPLPPTPPQVDEAQRATAAPNGLPSLEPMSPFMTAFDMSRKPGMEDEQSTQKRMYTEVADAAGVHEPPTPKSAGDLNTSTSTNDSSSSFGHDPMPSRVPSFNLEPPRPYVHGQPLSPLTEMSTPMTATTERSVSEVNPYERTLLASRQVAPPYSAASTSGATGLPSPNFPPPSPEGMSVPGSISDSPQRWEYRDIQDNRYRRPSSMMNSEDAYGGI